MTTATTTRPLTAWGFLFDEPVTVGPAPDPTHELASRLGAHDVARSALRDVHRLSGPAVRAVDREVAAVVRGLLDVDLAGVVVAAWRTYTDLVDAADRTLAAPGSEEVVVLAAHHVTWASRPHVDLLVDGRAIASVGFECRFGFELHGVVAVLRLGQLVALSGGECVITAGLAVAGQLLAERQRRLGAALVVSVDPPVRLAGTAGSFPAAPR